MRHAWVRRVGMVVLVGVMGLAGDTYAASVKNPPAGVPRVVDANNKLVGQVIGTDPGTLYPNVVLNISMPSIIAQVRRDSFRQYNALLFSGENCSGQTYLFAPGDPPLFPFVAIINNVVYGLGANTAPGAVMIVSYIGSAACEPYGNTTDVIIADPIIDLSTQFTPPYSFVYP